ncbi:MAG: serine/threonine-protein kinase [Jatrophihabitans sp.]
MSTEGGDQLMPREQIEHYTLDGVLGSGTSGTVYRGTDTRDGTIVAVKILDRADVDAVLTQLRAEAAAMRAISDPHCVRVLDVIERRPPAIVTEYVHGASLRAVLDTAGPLTGPQALAVIRGSLLGLAAVHGAGLLHGDFKPDNILVDGDGVSSLIDFGLTRPAAAESAGPLITGSPAYMSPEQIRGGPIDHRSDLYACAAVLFELVTGRLPFTGDHVDEVMQRHLTDPAADPRTANHSVSASVAEVCLTGLAKRPEDRYQSAADFLSALQNAARRTYGAAWRAGTGLGAVVGTILATQAMPVEPREKTRARRGVGPKAIAGASLVAIVVVAAALVAHHLQRRTAQAAAATSLASSPTTAPSRPAGVSALGSTRVTFASPPLVANYVYYAASCPTPRTCLATGQTVSGRPIVSVTNDRGISWTTTYPDVRHTLGLLSCSNARTCVAGYYDTTVHMRRTVDGGATWLNAVSPHVTDLQSISCPSASQCLAVGGAEQNAAGTAQAIATHDGGATWHLAQVPGPASSVSCADAMHCWVAGAFVKVWATDAAGTSWRPVSPPGTFPPPKLGRGPFPANTVFPIHAQIGELGFYVNGVAFSNDNDGIAFGGARCGGYKVTQCPSGVYRTTDGAKTWTFWPPADVARYGDGVYGTCIASACLVVTDTFSKSVLISTSDGQAWTQRRDFGQFAGRVTCTSDGTTCIIVGHTGLWISRV